MASNTNSMGQVSARSKSRSSHRILEECEVQQYAKEVVSFSSEYDSNSWAARLACGPPTVYPRYGDIPGAWAQGSIDSSQFIELEYEESLYIDGIDIYETYNGGAVIKIEAQHPSQQWATLWETDAASRVTQSRIFKPQIQTLGFSSNKLRLTLDCQLAGTWCEIDSVKMIGKRFLVDPPPPLSALSDDLWQTVNNKQFSDVQFLVEGEIVYAHKVLLSARSEYFRAMFTDGLKETESSSQPIKMPDVSYSSFVGMLQYIYTNTLDSELSPISMVELIRVADRFSMKGLQTLSHFYLSGEINCDNVIQIFREAVDKLPVLDDVRQTCLHFITQHMGEVSKTPAFCDLPQSHMLEIIQETAGKLSIK